MSTNPSHFDMARAINAAVLDIRNTVDRIDQALRDFDVRSGPRPSAYCIQVVGLAARALARRLRVPEASGGRGTQGMLRMARENLIHSLVLITNVRSALLVASRPPRRPVLGTLLAVTEILRTLAYEVHNIVFHALAPTPGIPSSPHLLESVAPLVRAPPNVRSHIVDQDPVQGQARRSASPQRLQVAPQGRGDPRPERNIEMRSSAHPRYANRLSGPGAAPVFPPMQVQKRARMHGSESMAEVEAHAFHVDEDNMRARKRRRSQD